MFVKMYTITTVLLLCNVSVFVESKKPLMCYIAGYAGYRPDRAKFTPEMIDVSLCTHVIYAHLGISPDSANVQSTDPFLDFKINGGFGYLEKMSLLKKKNPSLKILFSLGGWEVGSVRFTTIVESDIMRKEFVKSIINTIKNNNFDGVDMNWMYPYHRGGKPEDVTNYIILLKELRKEIKKEGYILVALMSGNEYIFKQAYDLANMAQQLDYVLLLSYDLHGSWDGKTGVFAPFRYTDPLSVTSAVEAYIKGGVAEDKLLLGFGTHGRTFTALKDFEDDYMAVPSNDSFSTPLTKEKGFMGFNEICYELTHNDQWTKHWHDVSSTPFLTKGRDLISYDDETSYLIKLNYLKEKNLGGAVVWSLDTDDFRGDCYNTKFYLTSIIKREFDNTTRAYKETQNNENDQDEEETETVRPIIISSVSIVNTVYN